MKQNDDMTLLYGTGWAFPPTFSISATPPGEQNASGVVLCSGRDNVAQSLQLLFRTWPGERIMRPEYGCDLHSVMFMNLTESTLSDLRRRIAESVARHEPRAENVTVTLDPATDSPGLLSIVVAWHLAGQPQRISGQLSLLDASGHGRRDMGDLIVSTGDIVMFETTSGNRTLMMPAQMPLTGTGRAMINGKPVCVISDLTKVVIPGIPYISSSFSIPGMGMVQMVMAMPDQMAKKTLSGPPLLLKGSDCQGMFIPTVPAMDPTSGTPVPDPTTGVPTPVKGKFIIMQVKVNAN